MVVRAKTRGPDLRLRFFDSVSGRQIFEKITSNVSFLNLNEGDVVELYGSRYEVSRTLEIFDLATETLSTNVYLDVAAV